MAGLNMAGGRKKLIIGGGVLLAVLLLVFIIWLYLRGQQTRDDRPRLDSLPVAVDQVPTESRNESADPNTTGLTPISSLLPSPSSRPESEAVVAQADNIGVLVRLVTSPSLRLSIEEIDLTDGRLTADFYQPEEGEPYSLLQLYGPDGVTLLSETPFTLPTQAIGEGGGAPLVAIPTRESTAYLVVPRPQQGVGEVRLTAPTNRAIIDRQLFVVPPQNISPQGGTSLREAGKLLTYVWQRITNHVWAAGEFDILVINEVGAEGNINRAVDAAERMIGLDPWNTFRGKVKVTGSTNTTPLGCAITSLGTGSYPICSDGGTIAQVANQLLPSWDAVVVVTSVGTQSGTVFSPRITAVGAGVDERLLIHEFGHAVGSMVDEYGYQIANFPIQGGINCFNSESECREALEPFAGQPGGECRLGCTQVSEWRPATRIMHNTYDPLRFGPLERCLMYNSIAAVLGEEQEEGCESLPPEQVNQRPQFYWGWRR